MNNKRKLENGTLEQKFSIILHDLFSFSVFFVRSFIALQTAALKAANLIWCFG